MLEKEKRSTHFVVITNYKYVLQNIYWQYSVQVILNTNVTHEGKAMFKTNVRN